jgi:antitoxin (DNA-binding transcriptional repressor) of toxin-antitoxin stability system
MIKANIQEVKTHLSEYLNRLDEEKELVICKRNVPVAILRPVNGDKPETPRKIGMARGEFVVPASFFEVLPTELVDSFEGGKR